MNLDRRIRRSAREAESLFGSRRAPILPRRRERGPVVAMATGLLVLIGFGILAVLNQPDGAGPVQTAAPTTVPPSTTPPTTGETPGTEPLLLEDGVSLVSVQMEDGTRIAVLLPTFLVSGPVEVTTRPTGANIKGPGFEAVLSYDFCAGSTQDAGSMNRRGSLVAWVADRLVVCRPDQFLTLEATFEGAIRTLLLTPKRQPRATARRRPSSGLA
jgi:hypothetical protein